MIETQCETMVEEFAQRIAQSGLTMEQYLQFSGMTVDQLKDQVRPEATTRIQSSLVLEQIAKEENIEVTDAEVEKMAKAYGMEADKLKEYMGDAEKESMKKDIAITKAVDLIMDNVKERAKAKKKADAEESTEE